MFNSKYVHCMLKHVKSNMYYETNDMHTLYVKYIGTTNIKKYYVFYNGVMMFNHHFFHDIYKRYKVFTFPNKRCFKSSEFQLKLYSYLSLCKIIEHNSGINIDNLELLNEINNYHLRLVNFFDIVR